MGRRGRGVRVRRAGRVRPRACSSSARPSRRRPRSRRSRADGGHARFGAVAWGEAKANKERAGLLDDGDEDGDGLDARRREGVRRQRRPRRSLRRLRAGRRRRGLGRARRLRRRQGRARASKVLARETTLGLDAVSFGGHRARRRRRAGRARPRRGLRHEPRRQADFDAALVRFFAQQRSSSRRAASASRARPSRSRASTSTTRKAFGKPIGHFQAVAFTLADRAMDVDAARGLVWRAASAWDAYDAGDRNAREREGVPPSQRPGDRLRARGRDALRRRRRAAPRRRRLHARLPRREADARREADRPLRHDRRARRSARGARSRSARRIDPGLVLPTPETQNAFV